MGQSTAAPQVQCMGALFSEDAVLDSGTFGLELAGDEIANYLQGIQCVSGGGLTLTSAAELSALLPLERVEGTIMILNNPELETLDGLSSLTHIGGSIIIDGNPVLVDATGLSGLVIVGRKLAIGSPPPDGEGNDALITIPDLESLESARTLFVSGNETLSELPSPPTGEIRDIYFLENPSLLAASAWEWGETVAETVVVCGCLDDPIPECSAVPPPPPGG